MTMVSLLGITAMSRSEVQSKVLMETMIITATSAPIGICRTQGCRVSSIPISVSPATSEERRVRPPEVTLITDCPIMAQPAMPPKKPVTMLATP